MKEILIKYKTEKERKNSPDNDCSTFSIYVDGEVQTDLRKFSLTVDLECQEISTYILEKYMPFPEDEEYCNPNYEED